jgi:chromosome partitioning protein
MRRVFLGAGVVTFWNLVQWIDLFFTPFEPLLKLFAFILSPLLTLLAFYLNRRDRRELMARTEALGHLRAEAHHADKAAIAQQAEIAQQRSELERGKSEIEKLQSELRGITEGAQQLWKLRPAKPFAEYKNWLRDPVGARIVTIGNLKGGVGKTTIAANLAAYINEKLNKSALLIDLDYQGSLSNMLLLAIQSESVESHVDRLFSEAVDLFVMQQAKIQLAPKLSRGWLVPANYSFAQLENKLLLQWLINQYGNIDVRYRLANALLQPQVRRGYDAIILDMPPRMTMGSVNALVASHYFLVPTVLDKLSVEAVPQFITNVKAIKNDMDLDIDLAGIVGTLTRQDALTSREEAHVESAREGGYLWRENTDYVFPRTVPRRQAIASAAGEDIAYLLTGADGTNVRAILDPLFEDICKRIGLLTDR